MIIIKVYLQHQGTFYENMNLGDGLLFEVNNGKPKLLLLNHAAAKRTGKQVSFRHAARQRDSKSPVSSTEKSSSLTSCKPSTAKANSETKNMTRLGQTKPSGTNKKAGVVHHQPGLKETVSRMANEQQLQVTIQTSNMNQGSSEDQERHGGHTDTTASLATTRQPSGPSYKHDKPAGSEEWNGLSSCLTGRGSRASGNTKNGQQTLEPDEQVAMKQQSRSAPACLQNISHRKQPAAIISNIRLGEVPAGDEEQSLGRREEERREWLEELDKQREEMALRREQERQLRRQTEDHDLWARHFDSLQRGPLFPLRRPPSALPPSRGVLDELWDRGSSCGGQSASTASLDASAGQTNQTSYLRSMTALLDPVQVEERTRRRLKQQEHQRAIDAQVAERRLQKEREEARRREEERAEERRVAQEREELERRFQLERDKERGRKNIQKAQQGAPVSRQQQPVAPERHVKEVEDVKRSESCRDTSLETVVALPPVSPASLSATHVGKRAETAEGNVCQPRGDRSREKRPAWNTHRPGGGFLLASERYPADLQKSRRESRMRRQAELLVLQEKNCVARSCPAPPPVPPANTDSDQARAKAGSETVISERGRSLPVPAVKNKQQDPATSQATPPRQEFVPYIRTDEVTMEPLQHTHTDLVHTSRQQEILRGLHLLRQGLLQKQRELEADLNPLLKLHGYKSPR